MTALTCASGTAWAAHFAGGAGCLFCAAAGDEASAEFQRLVASGHYDAQGFTAKERKARDRKAAA